MKFVLSISKYIERSYYNSNKKYSFHITYWFGNVCTLYRLNNEITITTYYLQMTIMLQVSFTKRYKTLRFILDLSLKQIQ